MNSHAQSTTHLMTLAYELLDAQLDTAELAQESVDDPRWAAHLDYLRALQRIGRASLAQLSAAEWTGPRVSRVE